MQCDTDRAMNGLRGPAGLAMSMIVLLGLGGCGGSPHSPVRTQRDPSTPAKATPLATMTKPGVPSTTTSPSAPSTSKGGPVPPGTEATSVTFISPETGFILGTAPCSRKPCSVILKTTDRGAHWVGLPAPRQAISYPAGPGLWGLRFADAVHGYAFGSGFWQTDNGGGSWRAAPGPARIVYALEAAQAHELVAVGRDCQPAQGGCNDRLALYHETIGGSWSAAAGLKTFYSDASIAVHGADVWALVGPSLYVSTDGGAAFSTNPQPCPSRQSQPTSITDDGSHVYLLCTGGAAAGSTQKYVYRTSGPGAAWTLQGKPPLGGDGGQISAGSDSAILIATSSGASLMYRSTDGGRTWSTALTEDDGGAGWADAGFTTSTQAIVVHGPPARDGGADGHPGRLLLSTDAGASWSSLNF